MSTLTARMSLIKAADGEQYDLSGVVNVNLDTVDDATRYDQNETVTGNWAFQGSIAFDINSIADGDATPSVSGGVEFQTANTGATTITDFDDPTTGQTIHITFNDAATTIQSGGNIKLQGGMNFTGAQYDQMSFFYNGSVWMERSRSLNS